ncbi:hypothetical protein BGZ76_010914 [Entomortierella beljakovae]|nr:hypothetical protein BGZ76_010914 [Entomortierella beljakovae]
MSLNFLFADEPSFEPVNLPNFQAVTWGNTTENSSTPSIPTISYTQSIVHQALSVTEIAFLIRGELQGINLKSMVLVNRFWWKTFGPYLWENIYIDADPEQGDQHIIFRNGLAARSLTLSIYDPLDRKGVTSYVAEKCKNITQLHLKLFTPDLITLRDQTQQQPPTPIESFAQKEDCETNLLDSLLSKLPFISELSIYLANEDIQPEILWCATKLPQLRKLKISGGLNGGNYIMHKNWRCNWPLILRIVRECPNLHSLDVSWKNSKQTSSLQTATQETIEENPVKAIAISPSIEHIPSLKYFNVSNCQLGANTLESIFRSCPNLREVGYKSIEITPSDLEKNIEVLMSSCHQLKLFEFLDQPSYNTCLPVLFDGPLLSIPKLSLDARTYGVPPKWGLEGWTFPMSFVTSLELKGVNNYTFVLTLLTNINSLYHLTLEGDLLGRSWASMTSYLDYWYINDQSSGGRLPNFSSQDTLQSVDVSRLNLGSFKFHELFFGRVQALTGLKRLEINNRQLQDARIEETWMDPDADQNIDLSKESLYPEKVINPNHIRARRGENYLRFGLAYAHTKDRQRGPEGEEVYYRYFSSQSLIMPDESNPEGLSAFNGAVDRIPDKIFTLFPTVEYLYVHDDLPVRDYKNMEHYISEHIASAIVLMMPKLKVLAYDKYLGEGLSRVKKLHNHIIYDQIRKK